MSKAYNVKIPGCVDCVGTTVDSVLGYVFENFGPLDMCEQFELKVILNELLLNAVKHGCDEDKQKCIHIVAGINRKKEFHLLVRDEGTGFDCHCLQAKSKGQDESDIMNMKETGRGIVIVRSLCDKIVYNSKGNKVLIVKKLYKM